MKEILTIQEPASKARALFAALLPHPYQEHPIVWLHNFEAERFWVKPGTIQLPGIGSPQDAAIVNRLEEFGIFLAGPRDTLILRENPDPAFVDYVKWLGFDPPSFLAVCPQDPNLPITAGILQSEIAQQELASLAGNCWLVPFARTRLEDDLISLCGIRCPTPPSAICKIVNSKVYGRRIARQLGLNLIPGSECTNLDELARALEACIPAVSGGEPYVVKESMGVSGKGLVVLDSAEKTRRTLGFLRRLSHPLATYAFVVERWVDKEKDVNYQIFIDGAGGVELLAIKEILTEGGVHRGHRFPPELTAAQRHVYEEAAQEIGRRLWQDGYTGIAGIDSVVTKDGTVFPLLEINARFNMSTFHLAIEERLQHRYSALAKFYNLRLQQTLDFDCLAATLGDGLYSRASGRGAIVLNFATVNCNVSQRPGQSARGRLYIMLIGESQQDVARLDENVGRQLREAGLAA
jgi:hypothetical protein